MIRIYYRVSTDKQDFEMQVNAVENYLDSHNISEYEIYSDHGISGTTTQRPEYQRLLVEIVENDLILVYEFSRLWRDMEEQSRVTKMFFALGVQIISTTEGTIRNEEDSLTLDIKGVVNQHESRRIRRRSIQGIRTLQDKVATGEAVWNGRGKDKQKRKKDGYFKRWNKGVSL
jgi:site-specific DNA recombinase